MGVTWEQLERRLFVIKNHALSNKTHQRAIYNIINGYFLQHEFNEDTIYDFVQTLTERGLASGTINNYGKLLKHICHILKVDYMRDFTYRKDKGSNIVPWTATELDKLVKAGYTISFRVGLIIETLCQTALRSSELINLRIQHFNGTEFKLMETKAQEIQYAQVLPPLAKKIAELIEEVKKSNNDYIFGCYKGKLDRETLNDYIRKAGALTGIKRDIRSHIIRHSVCTVAVKRNTSVLKVQRYMRHKNVATTQRYSHLDKDDVREVAETISTSSMSFDTLVRRIKEFRDQFPNLPYKISILESQDKITLEVCK